MPYSSFLCARASANASISFECYFNRFHRCGTQVTRNGLRICLVFLRAGLMVGLSSLGTF